MPIRPEHRTTFERLRKKLGIVFTGTIPSERWPENHRNVFQSIEKLKRFKYGTYATTQENEDGLDWKGKAKKHARKLSEKAEDCVSRNEATWRFACEPLVFSRLTSEIACKICRKRIWRSEIEAKLDDETRAASKLKKRQENRDPCRCPRNTRPNDEDERVGLNRLFIDRAEDKVVHPPDLAQQLPQEQKPDRVYGLRQTRNFEDLLFKELGNHEFLGERLLKQPHPTVMGEALLFPFLVIEAKAGNAPDDWSSICLQTAFPIYTYLNVQQSLKSATSQQSKWAAGPLVWFFMSRGDDWRLSLAYRKAGSPHHTTEIVQVWNGCIANRDDALQLFLIVDYMSDWARDVYRPALLTELRVLASADPDVATVFTDTDIYSSGDSLPFATVDTSQNGHHDIQAAFKSLDSNLGIIRHIAPIETRFLSLFITADNIQTFLLSMSTKIREYFIRRVLDQFRSTQRPCLLSSDQLSAVEDAWTGQSRPRAPFNLRKTRFYTVHLISYHISVSWEQIRELCVIAIAEDAFETLVAGSKLKAKRGKTRTPFVGVNGGSLEPGDTLIKEVSRLRRASADRNLLASISRSTGYIDTSWRATWPWFKADDALIWELVNNAYRFYKKGELEPELPFLRISTSYETQEIDQLGSSTTESNLSKSTSGSCKSTTDSNEESSNKPSNDSEFQCNSDSDTANSCSNHHHAIPPSCGNLQVSEAGAVLVYGGLHHFVEGRSPSDICVYIVHGALEPPSMDSLARIIKETFEDRDVYHTTRDSGRLNLQDKRHRKIWNLRKSYGVFRPSKQFNFSRWLIGLNQPLPTRQGSRRGPHDSGRSIFDRQYSPWQDPRLNYGRPSAVENGFVTRLLVTEATAWAWVAKEKANRGVVCCALCARENVRMLPHRHSDTDEECDCIVGLCCDCNEELSPPGDHRWPFRAKRSMRRVLEEIRSGALTSQTNGYLMATPPWFLGPMSFANRAIGEDSDANSRHAFDHHGSESGANKTSDDSAQDQRTAESIISPDASIRIDIDDNSATGQTGQSSKTPADGTAVTRKRKRRPK